LTVKFTKKVLVIKKSYSTPLRALMPAKVPLISGRQAADPHGHPHKKTPGLEPKIWRKDRITGWQCTKKSDAVA
jgi:hypothetical protein